MQTGFIPTPILTYFSYDPQYQTVLPRREVIVAGVTQYMYILPVGGWLSRGAYLTSNLALRPGVGFLRLSVLPITFNVQRAGVLALSLDVASYYITGKAFELVAEATKLTNRWIESVNLDELRAALGPAKFNELTANGQINSIQFLVQMPAAWLTDP